MTIVITFLALPLQSSLLREREVSPSPPATAPAHCRWLYQRPQVRCWSDRSYQTFDECWETDLQMSAFLSWPESNIVSLYKSRFPCVGVCSITREWVDPESRLTLFKPSLKRYNHYINYLTLTRMRVSSFGIDLTQFSTSSSVTSMRQQLLSCFIMG